MLQLVLAVPECLQQYEHNRFEGKPDYNAGDYAQNYRHSAATSMIIFDLTILAFA